MTKLVTLESARQNWPYLNKVRVDLGDVLVNLEAPGPADPKALYCSVHQIPLERHHLQNNFLVCPQQDTKVTIPVLRVSFPGEKN